METIIKDYLKHFKERGIDLYGNEYYIGEQLLKEMNKIKDNDYSYNVQGMSGTQLENNYMLFTLDYLGLIEWGTAIRSGWIDHGKRDIFDLLLKLLEKHPDIINFTIPQDGYCDEYDYKEADQIKYIEGLLN